MQLLFIPEAYGGMDGGARDCFEIILEMCKICLGIGTAFFAIQLGSKPIIFGGTEERKSKWLGKIAEGNTLVAYAVTEAGAGSNLAALKTNAEPVQNDAGEVAQLVSQNALKIPMGCGVFDQKAAHDFMETHSYNQQVCSSLNVINDMDLVANILFAR